MPDSTDENPQPAGDNPVPPPMPYTPIQPPMPYTPVPPSAPAGSTPPPPPPQTYYPTPMPYGQAGPATSPKTLSLLAMIFGIVGVPASCCYGLGIIFAIAGVVLGHIGVKRESAKGMALTGLITGYVGIAAAIVEWIAIVVFAVNLAQYSPTY